MATLLKVHKEDKKENESKEKELTPEYIQGILFYFHNAAHKYHLDTKSYEIHKTLDGLYNYLVGFKDDISELLMGYTGKRIGEININKIPAYSESEVTKTVNEIKDFAYELYEWAGDKKYCDIENKAQDLSGVAAKTLYLLTLK